MNIFALHNDPIVAAEYHTDKHCVKMILESAQMLSTTQHIMSDAVPKFLYKPTHINHTCSKWARETGGNYRWLARLALALCAEYTQRYGRRHKSQDIIEWSYNNIPDALWESRDIVTPFAQAMPKQYQQANAVQAYREYYIGEKPHLFTWKTQPPRWIPKELIIYKE